MKPLIQLKHRTRHTLIYYLLSTHYSPVSQVMYTQLAPFVVLHFCINLFRTISILIQFCVAFIIDRRVVKAKFSVTIGSSGTAIKVVEKA